MKKLILLFSFLIFLSQLILAQQAWTKPKGKYFAQLGISLGNYNSVLDRNDNFILLNREVTNHVVQGYCEYGISDRLMGSLIVPFNLGSSKKNGVMTVLEPKDGSLNALGNIEAGLTYNFYKKNGLVLSAKLNTELPTASYDLTTGLRSGADALSIVPSLLAGYGGNAFFASAEIGYGYRTNNYSSQRLGLFQIGKFFGKSQRFIAIFNVNYHFSNDNGSYDDGLSKFTGTYFNNLSFLAYSLKFGYKITPKIMFWTNVRGALPPSHDISSNSEPFPGLSFSVSYAN